MKKTLLGITLLSIFYLVGCLKNDKSGDLTIKESKRLSSEAKSWLMSNSKRLANGELSIALTENRIVVGVLSWDAASVTHFGNADIVKVPFVFKNARLLSPVESTDLPIMVNLYFKKENTGRIFAAVKISAFNNNSIGRNKEIYFSIYNTELENIAEKFTDSKNVYRISMRDVASTENSATSEANSNCEQLSYTQSYIVSCYSGELNNTICSYKKRTVTRYRCYGETGGGEQEEIDWIDNEEPGGGWSEYEEEAEEYANQDIIDSLQGNPCAQDILKQLPNIDIATKDILQNIFGVTDQVNIKFIASTSLADNVDGDTQCGGSSNYFNCTVRLNNRIINQATKDYIVSIFLHEALHAYINHQRTILDTTTFKEKFPIYWAYRGNDAHHNLMANNYVSMMASIIRGYNPNIADSNARALAWGGLQMTTAWKSKSDTNYVKQVNLAGREPSDNNYLNYSFTKCQ